MNSDNEIIGPINLGNPVEFSILELAEMIINLVGRKVDINYLELPQDDPTRRKPNIELAENEIDWHPNVDIVEGLKKTILYFEELLSTQSVRK